MTAQAEVGEPTLAIKGRHRYAVEPDRLAWPVSPKQCIAPLQIFKAACVLVGIGTKMFGGGIGRQRMGTCSNAVAPSCSQGTYYYKWIKFNIVYNKKILSFKQFEKYEWLADDIHWRGQIFHP